jgi:hypothetical protein
MNKGAIKAISISEKRGQLKTEVPEANIVRNHGIENDGHAGDWDRQVTCLDWASVQPEFRSGRLRREHPDRRDRTVCPGRREQVENRHERHPGGHPDR